MDRPLRPLLVTALAGLGPMHAPLASAQGDPGAPRVIDWEVITPSKLGSTSGATVALDVGNVIVVAGAVGERETITLEAVVDRKGITGFRLEALANPELPAGGPGLATSGNFVLSEFSVAQAPKGSDGWRPVVLERASADFEQAQFPVVSAIDGAPHTGWAVWPQTGVAHEAIFETQRDAGSDLGVKLRVVIDFQYGDRHVLGRMRLSCTTSRKPLRATRDESDVVAAQGRVPVAITRGVSFLLSQQEIDGSWSCLQTEYHHGMTALAAYALLKCGVRRTHPAVVRAFDFMSTQLPAKTYEAGLELMARGALEDEAELLRMQEITDRLLSWQAGGFSYPLAGADLSNTQYAAMGLRAAKLRGVEIDDETWLRLGEETLLHQEKIGGAYDPAGFGYAAGGPAYGSVTTGGVCVLQICHDMLLKAAAPRASFMTGVKRGLSWLDRNFSPHANPKGDSTWVIYWLYGVERVGALCRVAEFGGMNWYREGASRLVADQKEDGSWDGGAGPQPSTAFALLFLARATSSVSNAAVRGENLFGADDPKADVSLRASGDSPLTVWISSFGEGMREQLAWPQDGGRGPRVTRVDYVLPARALLADARAGLGAWRYSREPPTGGFELPGFDDSKWKSGPGAFGQPGMAGTAVRTEWTNEQIWLRREFTLDAQPLVAPALRVQRSNAPPEPPDSERPALLALFDEEPGFAALVNEASEGGTIQVHEKDAFKGTRCLVVTPQQCFRAAMPGWSYAITEKPRPGEYRHLRFAWRKEGGGGIMLQLARNGVWDGDTRRVFAGPNELAWAGTQVDKEAPRKWTVVTVDLWKEFGGNGTLTGIAFVPMTTSAAHFDAIYLARGVDDFRAIPRDGVAAGSRSEPKRVAAAAPAASAREPFVATGAGPAIEVFVNGTRIFASDEEYRELTPVATSVPLPDVLKPGRNVIAVYARKTGAGQSVDVGIEDAQLLAAVPGNADAPCGLERFPAKLTFDRNATYTLFARVHVRSPPDGEELLLESAPLEVRIREALDAELLSYARDPSVNLIAQVGAVASASSAFDGSWLASFAADNLASRGWLSSDADRRPTLALELNKPVRADTILVTPIQMRGSEAERTTFRVRRVEVQVDQGRGGTFEIVMPEDFRKGVARLPKPIVVRRLDLKILEATGVDPVKSALGLGEVELQLRK